MSWNHRVVKTVVDSTVQYGIHECYYEEDQVVAITESPVTVVAFRDIAGPFEEDDLDPVQELRLVLERMLLALDKPVVDEAEL